MLKQPSNLLYNQELHKIYLSEVQMTYPCTATAINITLLSLIASWIGLSMDDWCPGFFGFFD